MFDEHQTRSPELSLKPPLIVIAASVGGMLLSFGLCGASSLVLKSRISLLGMIGFWLFMLFAMVLFVGAVWLVTVLIINALRN